MRKLFDSIFFILVLFSPILIHGEVHTLKDLLRMAESQNLIIKISELDKKITKEEYKIICAFPDPEIEFSKGKANIPGHLEKPDLWSMGLKWAVDNPLHRYFFLKSQKKTIQRSEIEALRTRHNIIRGLKTHYFKLIFHLKTREFVGEKLGSLEKINKIIEAKVSIGESKEIDLLRSTVEIQKCKTDLFRIQKSIIAERTALNEYLNYTLPQDFKIIQDFTFKPLPPIEEGIRTRIDKSPLILLKENKLAKEKACLSSERSSWFESFEVFGERGKEPDAKVWRVGIGIALPLFSRKPAHIRKAKYQKEKAQVELEHAQKHFLADIQLMIAKIRSLEREIETFQGAILEEGRKSLQLSEKLFKEGEIPLVVYLDSQNSFFEINIRYYQAISEWNILEANLEAQLGEEL
jgi:outer membrane protein TolC